MIQQAYIGLESIGKFKEFAERLNPQKVLLVRDKRAYTICGAQSAIEYVFNNVTILDFYDFQENPKIEDVYKGLSVLEATGADLIVGIGGGSVMDMAKLIRFLHSYSIDDGFKPLRKEQELIPLALLPTTAGTGAEATHFAVVYKNKKKFSLAHNDVLADVAVVNPTFTYKVPAYITACTGFDALAQAIEAYWNVNANDESDQYAKKAIGLLEDNLYQAVHSPNAEVRNKVSEGAYWAGRAINITKTTAPHAFSYPYTTYYGLPHGHAVAMTFPQFFALNYGNEENYIGKRPLAEHQLRMDRLYSWLHIDGKSTACQQITKYILSLGLSLSSPQDFNPKVILDNVNMERLGNNPVKVKSKCNLIINIT